MTDELRLFDAAPIVDEPLGFSGTISHLADKPREAPPVLSSGVALVRYRVESATLGGAKVGVGLAARRQVRVTQFYPLADQAAGRQALDEMEADVRRQSPPLAVTPHPDDAFDDDVDRALRMAR